jgi:hypothetical protein
MILTSHVCSFIVQTFLCTNCLCSSSYAVLLSSCWCYTQPPSLSLPTATLPTMSACLTCDSASCTVIFADLLWPDLTFTKGLVHFCLQASDVVWLCIPLWLTSWEHVNWLNTTDASGDCKPSPQVVTGQLFHCLNRGHRQAIHQYRLQDLWKYLMLVDTRPVYCWHEFDTIQYNIFISNI